MELNVITKPKDYSFSANPMTFLLQIEDTDPLLTVKRIRINISSGDSSIERYFLSYPVLISRDGTQQKYELSFDISSFVAPYIEEYIVSVSNESIVKLKATKVNVAIDLSWSGSGEYFPDWQFSFWVVKGGHSLYMQDINNVISCRLINGECHYLSTELNSSDLLIFNTAYNALALKRGTSVIISEVEPISTGIYYRVNINLIPWPNRGRCYLSLGETVVCELFLHNVESQCSFVFRSRIGSYERFSICGKIASSPSISESSMYLSYKDGVYIPKKQYLPYKQKLDAYIGFLNKNRYKLLLELLIAEDVVFCFYDGDKEIRIPVFVSGEVPTYNTSSSELQGYKVSIEFPDDIAPYQLSRLGYFLMSESEEKIITENNINIIL